jgi:hypothetical protein
VLAALALSWLWPAQLDTQPTMAPAAAAPVAAAEQPTIAAAAAAGHVQRAPAAKPASPEPSRRLELPDGTSVPALNDAIDAAPLQQFWGNWPWSPIIGVVRGANGIDWYEHADGSCSTTQMVWRSDLGRHLAMTRVAHPGPAPAAPAIARR